jgi:glycosyltransferase involved in cell wall biosynthesis
MRIAYLHYLHGADTALNHVRQFARAAGQLGHDVSVHAMNLAPPDDATGGSWLRARSRLKTALGRYLHDPKEMLWNVPYFRHEVALLSETRPDVVLVRTNLLAVSCVFAARRLGLPLVLEINAPAEENRLYADEYRHLTSVAGWLEGWKLRRVEAATVVSSALRDHLMRRHGIPSTKLTVVPNGADTERFRPDTPPDPALRARVGAAPVIGFVGSFQKWHGTEMLAGLIDRVGHARPDARFVLAGDGPDSGAVRPAMDAAGATGLFLGRVPHDDVAAIVAAFDIAVLPDCGFYMSPLKVIEWMAAGKAVVAPDYQPLRDVIDSGVHGLLFTPGDTGALLAAVLRLIDDAPLRRSLGRAAAARAHASLSWRDNARRVVDVCLRAHSTYGSLQSPHLAGSPERPVRKRAASS